jgi:2-polyprenyl-3-methyl-5-hydroxy-6-metoxy-1,4-benzoquinol methylase
MFAGHTAEFWDDRYSSSGYAFGTAPNQFLTEQHQRLKAGMKTLVVGDGEGRNGVWLASQGLDVLSVDLSPVGLEKTQALAAQHQVSLQTECADLTTWNWAEATYDLVVSIYVHFAPDVRQQVHRSMLGSLKPGGLIILEGFNPDQIQYQRDYNSGGPNNPAMLYDPAMLRQDFVEGEILELMETITELHEGQYHDGKASVVRLVLKK